MYVCLPSMKAMYFSILLGMQFISKLLLFSYGTYLLHNKMGIIPKEIMKNDRDLELFWANVPIPCTVQ